MIVAGVGVLALDLVFKGFDHAKEILEPIRFVDVFDLQFVGCDLAVALVLAPEKRLPSVFGQPGVFESRVPQKRYRYRSRVRTNNNKGVLAGCTVFHQVCASALDLIIPTTRAGVGGDAHFVGNGMKSLGDRKRKKRMSERSRRRQEVCDAQKQNARRLGTTPRLGWTPLTTLPSAAATEAAESFVVGAVLWRRRSVGYRGGRQRSSILLLFGFQSGLSRGESGKRRSRCRRGHGLPSSWSKQEEDETVSKSVSKRHDPKPKARAAAKHDESQYESQCAIHPPPLRRLYFLAQTPLQQRPHVHHHTGCMH